MSSHTDASPSTDFWSPRTESSSRPPKDAERVVSGWFRERPDLVSLPSQRLLHIVMFAGVVALLLLFFRPSLLFSETTSTGGDTGAHIYAPWYLKNHLLPHGLISGWSPDWFAGFPILTFYFPLVPVVQVLLSYAIGYGIAFKIGSVLGTFFMPVGVYVMLKLMRLSFPVPVVGAVITLGFLFMDSYSIYGGNIPSSLSGEYSFALSIGLCFVFYGLAYRLAREEHGRPVMAAIVLAAAVLSHMVPVIMLTLTLPLLLFWSVRRHGLGRSAVRFGTVLGVAFALTAFWSVPFVVRIPHVANMHWQALEGWGNLLPRELWVYLGLGAFGCLLAALRRDERILLFLWPGLLGLAIYFFLPLGHAWNGRFIPFWYLTVFLSAAYLVGAAVPIVARAVWNRRAASISIALSVATLLAVGGWILRDKEPSYIDQWIEQNFEGYETRAEFPTFKALMDRMASLPKGRVMWEPTNDLGKYGTPIALMTLPYWSGQPSMEGLYYESSMTTPFHFLIASEVAREPSNPIGGLPYRELDLDRALLHMEMYDVSYFIAITPEVKRAARRTDGFEYVDRIEEFEIYRMESAQVAIPENEPVVLDGGDWIEANLDWWSDPDAFDTPLAGDGPEAWQRAPFSKDLPATPLEHGGETVEADVGDDEISFTTDAIGEPHLVRTSFFPNWRVEGAEGPYIASPTVMVVIPTQEDVRLVYRRTWAEWSGLALTSLVTVALVLPWTRRKISVAGNA